MKKVDNQTLGEKTAGDLIKLIQDNKYVPGDKIPTELELSKTLKVSRNTVREALRMLASRNIVDIKQGSGTFVSDKEGMADDPFGFAFLLDKYKLTDDLMQIRIILEPTIAAIAAQNANEEEIKKLKTILDELEILIKKKKDFAEKDVEFHEQIAKCTHNIVMIKLIPVISRGVEIFSKVVKDQERKQTLISHRKIYEAIAEKNVIAAKEAMLFHLMYNHERYENE